MTYEHSPLLAKLLANGTFFFAGVGLASTAVKVANLFL